MPLDTRKRLGVLVEDLGVLVEDPGVLVEDLSLLELGGNEQSQDPAVFLQGVAVLQLSGTERLQEPDICSALFLQARDIGIGDAGGAPDITQVRPDCREIGLETFHTGSQLWQFAHLRSNENRGFFRHSSQPDDSYAK